MSDAAPASAPAAAAAAPLAKDALLALIQARIPGATADPIDRWDLTVVVEAAQLREAILFLRDDARTQFDLLLDIAGVDYLSYPGHRGPRFAAVYVLKSLRFGHRLRLKVRLEEDATTVPSIHDCYKIADWMERETWDQVGIVFQGHPNLKRLLNHHEFVGHPLRKDYPCQKRQKLTVNDPMVDQLTLRLRQLGYTVLDDGGVTPGPARTGGIDGQGDPGGREPDLTQNSGKQWGVL